MSGFVIGMIAGGLIVGAVWIGVWYFKKRRAAFAKKAEELISGK